jgi:hypothetical protein
MASDLITAYDRLRFPFLTDQLSWRVGATNAKRKKPEEPFKGIPLAYIDARDVMERLDDVLKPENWQCRYIEQGAKTVCEIGVNIGAVDEKARLEWVWKADGAGDTDMEAEKGALSDAFKRAAVRWGVGRYLYGLKSGWIEIEQRGQSFVIPDIQKPKLDALHDNFIQSMEWGDRTDRNTARLLVAALKQLDTNALEGFEQANAGVIATLPVAMRTHIIEMIEHIGKEAARKEAA